MLSQENLAMLPQPKVAAPAETPKVEEPKPISTMDAALEPVQNNQRFLKKLAQSKRRVLKKARAIKKFSYGVGAVSLLLAVGSLVTAMTFKYQAKLADQNQDAHHLQGGKGLNLHGLSMSSLISTMIWGFVAAKAKQGMNAATKPESINIKQSIHKGIFMCVAIALACGLKYAGEDKMLNTFISEEFEGISLAQKAPVQQAQKPWWAEEPEEEDQPWWAEPIDQDQDSGYVDDEIDGEPVWEEEEEEVEPMWEEEEEEHRHKRHHKKHHKRHHKKHNKKHHRHHRDFDEDYEEDYEEEYRPRRHHRRHHEPKVQATRRPLYVRLQEKFANNPQALHAEYKAFACFTSVFILAIAVSFFAMMNSYAKAVRRHEFMLEIYKNPKAKVVAPEHAKQFIEHKKTEIKHKRLMKAQEHAQRQYDEKMSEIQKVQQELVAKNPHFFIATPAYEPPKLDDEAQKEYNYSLCESIDYQTPEVQAEAPKAEEKVTLSKAQFEAMVKIAPELSSLGVATNANQME